MSLPQWLRTPQVSALSVWDARGATEDRAAAQIARQLGEYDLLLGDGDRWFVRSEDAAAPIEVSPEGLVPVVRAHVFRDAEGTSFPSRGFGLTLFRDGVTGHLAVDLTVGASRPGRRTPANRCAVTILGPKGEDGQRLSIDPDLAEGVLRGIVRAWDPDSATVRDREAALAAAGRGHFAPLAGQRTWVSDRFGAIEVRTSRVHVTRADGGSYLFADDDLDPASAVHEVLAILDPNEATSRPDVTRDL